MSAPTTFRLERPRGGVVVLTLDRPDRYNAMTATMVHEIVATFDAIEADVDKFIHDRLAANAVITPCKQ